MEKLGYVNDNAYAARLAWRYRQERLYPRRRILEKLCEKGIDRNTAAQAVEELDGDEAQLALEFLRKKRYNIPNSRDEAEKQAAALGRYGFSGEDIRRAMRLRQEEDDYGD
jgi:regulatory protein